MTCPRLKRHAHQQGHATRFHTSNDSTFIHDSLLFYFLTVKPIHFDSYPGCASKHRLSGNAFYSVLFNSCPFLPPFLKVIQLRLSYTARGPVLRTGTAAVPAGNTE
jgi:hypothetical protein